LRLLLGPGGRMRSEVGGRGSLPVWHGLSAHGTVETQRVEADGGDRHDFGPVWEGYRRQRRAAVEARLSKTDEFEGVQIKRIRRNMVGCAPHQLPEMTDRSAWRVVESRWHSRLPLRCSLQPHFPYGPQTIPTAKYELSCRLPRPARPTS